MVSGHISDMKNWYAVMAPSDKRALFVLAGFLIVTLFWLLALLPSSRYRAGAVQQYQMQRELVEWMNANAARARAVAVTEPASGESLLALVERSARSSTISLQRYEPLEQGSVRLYLEGVVFDDLMQWLGSLAQAEGIEVAQISVDKGAGAGLVDVRLDLTQ